MYSYAQRDTLKINNGWQFCIDKNAAGIAGKWFEKTLPGTETVNLPHTWNIEEANQNHYGWGWYQINISIPKEWKNKNVVLQFGAINHTSFIYINGKKIAENIGDGFNKISVNLNEKIIYGKENTITVACNNDFGKNKVPYGSSFDWPNDGGIIRPAVLIISDNPAASWLHVTPQINVADSSG
ncbi:MAG: sugar-binding domain-containing protein, partial [Chitinophagaceae bacterium]